MAASAASSPVTLSIVGYSVVKDAFAKLTAAYQKTAAGRNVTFTQSFGASGTEASDVIAGQPADLVKLAMEPDVAELVSAGDAAASWAAGPDHRMVTNSLVGFIVRQGSGAVHRQETCGGKWVAFGDSIHEQAFARVIPKPGRP